MAYAAAVDISRTALQGSSGTTTTPTNQSSTAGDLLLVMISVKNNNTISTVTSGWTKLTQINSGASFTTAIFYAAAPASNPVLTWTNSAAFAAISTAYSMGTGTVDPVPLLRVENASTGSPHTISSTTSTRDYSNVLFLGMASTNGSYGTPTSGIEEVIDGPLSTAVMRYFVGHEDIVTSGSSTVAGSISGSTGAWTLFRVEVREKTTTTGIDTVGMQSGAWVQPDTGISASSLQSGVWVHPDDGMSVSSFQSGVWLDPVVASSLRRRQGFVVK